MRAPCGLGKGGRGLLCPDVPEEYGGFGADWLYNVVVIEELAKKGMSGPGFMVHSEMVSPYIQAWGSEDLKREWLPKMVAGTDIGAVAMTEPGAGSDLKELRMRAVRDGGDYVVNGQKTYISNGQNCDLIHHPHRGSFLQTEPPKSRGGSIRAGTQTLCLTKQTPFCVQPSFSLLHWALIDARVAIATEAWLQNRPPVPNGLVHSLSEKEEDIRCRRPLVRIGKMARKFWVFLPRMEFISAVCWSKPIRTLIPC